MAVKKGQGSKDVVRVSERLLNEFGDRMDHRVIRRMATEEVALFDGAKVRDFVPVIAWRLARMRLQEELDSRDPRKASRAS